jgi:hypothetical protein
MKLQKYEPMLRVTCRDGETYYVNAKLERQLVGDINSSKLIKLGENYVRTTEVIKIEPHTPGGYEDLPSEDQEKIKSRIEGYQKTFGEKPSQKQIDHWIKTEL